MKKNLITLGMILFSLHAYAMEGVIPNTTDVKQKKETVSVVTVDSINEQRVQLLQFTEKLLEFIRITQAIGVTDLSNPTTENVFEPNGLVVESAKAIAELAKIEIFPIENIRPITAIMANILNLTGTINCDIFSRKPMQELKIIIEEINSGVFLSPLDAESTVSIIDLPPSIMIRTEFRKRDLELMQEFRKILEKMHIALFPSALDINLTKKASTIDIISLADRVREFACILPIRELIIEMHKVASPSMPLQKIASPTTIDISSLACMACELAPFAQIMHDMSNILKLISETALKIQGDLKTLMLTEVRYN